jgi:hypothetical protein
MKLCCKEIMNCNHVYNDKFCSQFVYTLCVLHMEDDVYVEFIYFLKLTCNLKFPDQCKMHWMLLYLFRNFMNMFMIQRMEVLKEEDVLEKVLIQKKTNLASIAMCIMSQNMLFHINHSFVDIAVFCYCECVLHILHLNFLQKLRLKCLYCCLCHHIIM